MELYTFSRMETIRGPYSKTCFNEIWGWKMEKDRKI